MDEREFLEQLQELLEVTETDVTEGYAPDLLIRDKTVRTFDDVMMLTSDKGLVVYLDDDRFFLTIQRG